MRKSAPLSTLDVLKEGIAAHLQQQQVALDAKMVDILAVCVFARREELRRVFTEIVFQRSVDTHLVDYNYNVEVSSVCLKICQLCVASESFSKVNELLLVLELFLRVEDGKRLERVVIEMNQQEFVDFAEALAGHAELAYFQTH